MWRRFREFDCLVQLSFDLLVKLIEFLRGEVSFALQATPVVDDGIGLHPECDLLWRTVRGHVAFVVPTMAICLALDQGWSTALACILRGLADDAKHVEHVIAVGDEARDGVGRGTPGDVANGLMLVLRRELAIE